MPYGICNLGVVPLRAEPSHKSEMVSQVLFGECFECLEKRTNWCLIRLAFDDYEGWIDTKQYADLSEESFGELTTSEHTLVSDLVEFATDQNNNLVPITLGADVTGIQFLGYKFEGNQTIGVKNKSNLVQTALLYLNAPYLWGGKTPLGIDCSGFVQMVHKLNGHKLFRDASQQAAQGKTLSFIEESEPGDLAFFDNPEGEIVHVGIILKNNYIIHAHGKVRIDRLDHNGIFNNETNNYSHKLRILKKMI